LGGFDPFLIVGDVKYEAGQGFFLVFPQEESWVEIASDDFRYLGFEHAVFGQSV